MHFINTTYVNENHSFFSPCDVAFLFFFFFHFPSFLSFFPLIYQDLEFLLNILYCSKSLTRMISSAVFTV